MVKLIQPKPQLTEPEAKILFEMKDGADIYSLGDATLLRSVEKKCKDWVQIGKPQMYRGDGTDRVPYFGAIATATGYREAVKFFQAKKKKMLEQEKIK